MRVLDTSEMKVVSFGKEWPYPSLDPSSKDCIKELERNERLVTWLQPKGGTVEQQVPAIRIGGKFCALSLRMQKSLFRHVRLRRDFVNKEALSDGSYKLKIPILLLQEKVRTQTRFNMMRQRGREEEQDAGGAVREDPAKGQAQRDSSERRGVSAVSRKINTVLYDRVLPLADNISGAPALTSFRFTEEELLRTVLSNIIRRECPVLASDRGAMMRAFSEAYDSEMTDGRGVGMGAIAHASPCQASSQTTAFFLEGACLNP